MKPFHIALHVLPARAAAGPQLEIDGQLVTTLRVSPADRHEMLGVSFEQAVAALSALDRMYVEPDGSFLWTAHLPSSCGWQVDGNLFDRQGRLWYVELKGICPRDAFRQLHAALGFPPQRLMVQLLRPAVFVTESEFDRLHG